MPSNQISGARSATPNIPLAPPLCLVPFVSWHLIAAKNGCYIFVFNDWKKNTCFCLFLYPMETHHWYLKGICHVTLCKRSVSMIIVRHGNIPLRGYIREVFITSFCCNILVLRNCRAGDSEYCEQVQYWRVIVSHSKSANRLKTAVMVPWPVRRTGTEETADWREDSHRHPPHAGSATKGNC